MDTKLHTAPCWYVNVLIEKTCPLADKLSRSDMHKLGWYFRNIMSLHLPSRLADQMVIKMEMYNSENSFIVWCYNDYAVRIYKQ